MSNQPKAYVAGVGMICPIGANAKMTAVAVKAGVNNYQETIHYNRNNQPMTMALVPNDALPPLHETLESLPGLTTRQKRMLVLATPAIHEALSSVPLKEPVPLFMAGPETLPGCPKAIDEKFIDCLITQSDANIDRKQSRLFSMGRAGGLHAIDLAFKYFESTGKDVVLVGGVDTYQDHFLLGMLDSENRILAEDMMDAFAPGEAAGFLLLVSERVVSKLANKPLATLYPPGLANETGHRYSNEPYRGNGLADSFTAAINAGNNNSIQTIYSSLNGENFGAKEIGVAIIRNKSMLHDDYNHEHPADCFGDIGAAFGPVIVGLISENEKGWYLGCCSSEKQERAAIVVQV